MLNPLKALELYTGAAEPAVPGLIQRYLVDRLNNRILFIVRQSKQIQGWCRYFNFQNRLNKNFVYNICPLPEWDHETQDFAQSLESGHDLIVSLSDVLRANSPTIIIASIQSLCQKCPDPEMLVRSTLHIKSGNSYSFTRLKKELHEKLDYDNEKLCESPGQYAVRGGLIDVYPINSTQPYRIDFFGDEVESIRMFDPVTQRSDNIVEEIWVAPSAKSIQTACNSTILDYCPDSISWILHEPFELFTEDTFLAILKRTPKSDTWFGFSKMLTTLENDYFCIDAKELQTETLELYTPQIIDQIGGNERLEWIQEAQSKLFEHLDGWNVNNYDIYIVLSANSEKKQIKTLITGYSNSLANQLKFIEGGLSQGYKIDPSGGIRGIVIITTNEILGRHKQPLPVFKQRKLVNRSHVDHLLDFSELVNGEHVVHVQHGICIYRGIQRIILNNNEEEVISLEFDNEIILHLRLHDAHLLSRYIGLTKASPKLGRLGSSQWAKARRAAEEATLDFAAELLRLQASRTTLAGYAFQVDTEWQQEFESGFPYKETKDQLKAIIDVKNDMEKDSPMDRLICGDVGFGKTEVALRAAFKAAFEGVQVAIIAPTTVLVQQHFNTFCDRFATYPIKIDMLSRLRPLRQQKLIKKNLSDGKIDVIIGTHSLLSKTVKFKNLGLLIIDEEHRFGVKQKEKIKLIKSTVDVLSMSATPIPRTLQMALVGARDLSVIETPPRSRLPIQTIVKNYNSALVKDAIQFEINRGGQVFYLHNRVNTIEAVAENLRKMLPDLQIGVGHGQMDEQDLERVMTDFVAARYDVLVCTTIIESGLDIPNCNTIIIEGADRFGLAQLYQIRGRVGRFNRQAYAYLLLHPEAILEGDAKKRLYALKQHNQLGAGFRIAMRDLELRGAGNILGAKQSGYIAGVGFDLYCQLLRQSISRLKGEPAAMRIRASLRIDFVQSEDLAKTSLKENDYSCIHASIPGDYVYEPSLRIYFYRQLANAETLAQIDAIKEEMIDRFGPFPLSVEALLATVTIRCLAEERNIISIETDGDRLKCQQVNKKQGPEYLKFGNRFPRLTQKDPLLRLAEIKKFILNIKISPNG